MIQKWISNPVNLVGREIYKYEVKCSGCASQKIFYSEEGIVRQTIRKESAWLVTQNEQRCPECYPCVFTA